MKWIEIKKASQNNLKHIDVKIPLGSFTVICGLSGSGKSSLAFETLYAEGQRRYLQNLSHYIRQYILQQKQPEVESIKNLPPALALEQRNNVRSSRATVASTSGLSDHLRLIFEKLGSPFCPEHQVPLLSFSPSSACQYLLKEFLGERAYLLVPVQGHKIKDSKAFLKTLYSSGYSRLLFPSNKDFIKGKIINIEACKTLKKSLFFILVDRFGIEKETVGRLTDSLKQAFQVSQFFPKEFQAFQKEILVATLKGDKRWFSSEAQCPHCSFSFSAPLTSALFNFNSPLGACKNCEGYGYTLGIDENKVIPNPKLSLKEGAIKPFTMDSAYSWRKYLKNFCAENKISYQTPWCDLSLRDRKKIWNYKKGIHSYFKALKERTHKMYIRILLARYRSHFLCEVCKGSRLCKEVDSVFLHQKTYNDYMKMTLKEIQKEFASISFSQVEIQKCKEAIEALNNNLTYLNSVGLAYLHLNRPINTLSGGEFQRLNLSNQLGLRLSQVLYVLDEPTVGLHPRDTQRIIELLKELKNLGNTIVVVEHDKDMITHSDYVIELGPESGRRGGQVLWAGKQSQLLDAQNSNTTPYLKKQVLLLKDARPIQKDTYKYKLLLQKAEGHNLKKINLFIPLNRLVVVTGVSGSGKSSLISETLYPALKKEIHGDRIKGLKYEKLKGAEHLNNVVFMDQSDIGRTSRSFIISYLKSYDIIRNLFAQAELSRRRQFKPSHFSLNVEGGRCPSCKGRAYQEIEMVFMDSLQVPCEDCEGKKFTKEVLEVCYQDKNIFEVLNMTVEEGFSFFKSEASLLRTFFVLKEVGLAYLTLGQNIASLSGGERQRLKLAKELLNSDHEKTLYILDEPTKGLHFKEVDLLLNVLNKIVETGGSVLVIEHNLEVIKEADYIVDIGPEAGREGGRLVAEGTPFQLLKNKKSHTAHHLNMYLKSLSS